MNCNKLQNELSNLLLDPKAALDPAAVAHLDSCPPCKEELASLRSTFALLDAWTAPEPSPYFDQRMAVLLREELHAPPMNWFERLQTRLTFNTGRQFRPLIAGALATALVVGGGTFAEFQLHGADQSQAVEASSTVQDLQILDRNAQAFQQMDQLLDEDNGGSAQDTAAPAPPIS
jgi:hypothetical protein